MNNAQQDQLRVGVGLPQIATGDGGQELAVYASRAEELGFVRLWTLESVIAGATAHTPLLDGLHCLTYAAASTSLIGLGIAVIVLPARNPALLAKELASLDQLSGGRLLVGVGLGGHPSERAAELHFPTDRRTRRLTEGVEILRALWSTGGSYRGEIFNSTGVRLEPKPLQRPGPPVWFGGGAPPALARAARMGDGWIGSGSSSVSDFTRQAKQLEQELSRAGRLDERFPIAKRVYIAVEEDEQLARKRLASNLDAMYQSPGMAERVGICGSTDSCAQQLQDLVSAGARELVLNPLYAHLEQLHALAEVTQLLTS